MLIGSPLLAATPAAPTDRFGSMALFFVIALLVTAPFAIRTLRRSFADRASATSTSARVIGEAPDADAPDGTEGRSHVVDPDAVSAPDGGEPDGVGEVDDLATVVAAIRDAASELRGAGDARTEVVIVVPREARLDGRVAPASVAEAIVADAMRRSGLEIGSQADEPAGRYLTCRLVDRGTRRHHAEGPAT
jgi:hypothetical protein